MPHSPEPWKAFSLHITDAAGDTVISANEDYTSTMLQSERDIRRIVACVNACQGISTEELEVFGQFTAGCGNIDCRWMFHADQKQTPTD
jgi:hypothetical protein